ncbi:MAG: hypothetical protein MI922_16170 [Bacteroidales bacterium]|nr:hypothetical protein [Bacteroidales bacterium]
MRIIVGILIIITGCLHAQNSVEQNKIEKVWVTKDFFNTPESVCYDESRDVLYVSNVGGRKPWMKDGYGFISCLSTDGTMIDKMWVDGMDAPKGMGIYRDLLYVADLNKLLIIDIEDEKVIKRVKIPHAKALNDVAINDYGEVFISEFKANRVYRYKDGNVSVLLENIDFPSPNGLFCIGDSVLLATGKDIVIINHETGAYNMFLTQTGRVDGVSRISEDTFLYSHWTGKLFLHTVGEEQWLILSYSSSNYNIADICYVKEKNMVYIPTFFNNTVECHKLLE